MKERIFIVSDLHGQGNIYNGVVNYLDKLQLSNKNEHIILYINGDLIDRGNDSIEMLLDVIDRSNNKKGNIEVKMLAGNHELMMLEALNCLSKDNNSLCDWLYPPNGGNITKYDYDKLDINTQKSIIEFLGNLPLYVKLDGSIISKNSIIISHAGITNYMIDDSNNLKLKDILFNSKSEILWKRNNINEVVFNKVFGIVGHTPNTSFFGYNYDSINSFINIDGGCAHISCGLFHNSPLMELDYNSNKVLIHGFNFKGVKTYNHVFAFKGIIKCNSSKYNIIKNIKRRKLNNKVDVIYNNSNKFVIDNLVSSDNYVVKNI